LTVARSRDHRAWVEVKVSSHARVAIEVPELLHQLSLDHPVLIIAKISGDREVGFHLQASIPSVVFIPNGATAEDAELARGIARQFGIPFRSIPGRDVRDASGLPFVVFDSQSFSDWKRLLREIVR
jgi:hypothetical protein